MSDCPAVCTGLALSPQGHPPAHDSRSVHSGAGLAVSGVRVGMKGRIVPCHVADGGLREMTGNGGAGLPQGVAHRPLQTPGWSMSGAAGAGR